MPPVRYRTIDVGGLNVFYREAGNPGSPKSAACCMAFPARATCSGTCFRAWPTAFTPSHPTCRVSAVRRCRARDEFGYTFDNLARVVERFTELIGLDRFALYVFDYGAPTGFRIAMRHPERIAAIISQNGNAYEEGLSDGWNPIRAYWQDPSAAQPGGAPVLPDPAGDALAVYPRRG